MYTLLLDKSRSKVFSTCCEKCSSCLKTFTPDNEFSKISHCPNGGHKVRTGILAKDGFTLLACSASFDDINSTKTFKTTMMCWLSIPETLTKTEQAFSQRLLQEREEANSRLTNRINELLHNLIPLNTHNIQEITSIITMEKLTGNIKTQLSSIQSILSKKPSQVAQMLLRLIKNNLAMTSEFVAAQHLFANIPSAPPKNHPIHKVVLNVLHTFFIDFNDKNVYLSIQESNLFALLDYHTFRVALFHIFDNATKYIMPDSSLNIKFSESHTSTVLRIEMKSFVITNEDMLHMGEEGFSGKMASGLGIRGSGHGIYRTLKLLEMSGAKLLITPNFTNNGVYVQTGFSYEDNCFEIIIPKGSERKY